MLPLLLCFSFSHFVTVVLVFSEYFVNARTAKETVFLFAEPKTLPKVCFPITSSYFIKCNIFTVERTKSSRSSSRHFCPKCLTLLQKLEKSKIQNFGILHSFLLIFAARLTLVVRFSLSVCVCFKSHLNPPACSRFGCYHSLKKNNIA